MKELRDSNAPVRLVELENGQVGFAAKVAPLVKDTKFNNWYSDLQNHILIFYPAELIKSGVCALSTESIFGHEAQSENETHFFPTFEALGYNTVELSCEDAYMFSNCDFRQNNPKVGVYTKEAPNPKSMAWGIPKGTKHVPLQEMQEGVKYNLINWFVPKEIA